MKIICSKNNLMEGINIVQKAVSTKTSLPILEGILLEAGEQFKMTGNDLEIGIECFVEADIQQKGAIVINSRMMGDIVRRLPESEVLIEVKDNNLVIIECDNSHFEIKGITASGFPAIPVINREKTLSISQKVIREMIKQTIFSVSMDENRPILTGSMIEFKEGEITIVAIDGVRLALRKSRIENADADFRVVVPGKTLNEIIKILQPVDEELKVYSSGTQIMFDLGYCKVVSRLIEGEYLNYKSIIPQEFETKIKINKKDFLSSIERAHLITMGEKRYPVVFNIENEKLVMSSNTDIGAVREELRVDMTGDCLKIAFNPVYFIEALKTIEEESIEVFFTTSVGPCTIRSDENQDFVYLIVPVTFRFKNE